MKKRIKAAKEALGFDRSSFYAGILMGVFVAFLLSLIIPPLFGFAGGLVTDDTTASTDEPEIHADFIIKDLRETDNRMLIQLSQEPQADSVYVVSESDTLNSTNETAAHYLGSKGNASVGSTVSVSINENGGDVSASSGELVQVIGVRDGYTKVLYEFEV